MTRSEWHTYNPLKKECVYSVPSCWKHLYLMRHGIWGSLGNGAAMTWRWPGHQKDTLKQRQAAPIVESRYPAGLLSYLVSDEAPPDLRKLLFWLGEDPAGQWLYRIPPWRIIITFLHCHGHFSAQGHPGRSAGASLKKGPQITVLNNILNPPMQNLSYQIGTFHIRVQSLAFNSITYTPVNISS